MKKLEERIAEVSHYLQVLIEPAIFPEVQYAVEKKDKNLLLEACRKAKIPGIYIGIIVATILSIGPEQIKWPIPEY